MRSVAVVTTSRADYGIYRPILHAIRLESTLNLRLLVSGSHLSETFGMTVREIEAEGFATDERIEMLLASDSPQATAKSMGLAVAGFAQSFAEHAPDLLVVLGDRFEMHAAALASLPFRIPVAHIHGGEVTSGAIDEALRHSLTKLSHLHFVSTPDHGRRVRQLGEEDWRVTVCGAPALDNVRRLRLSARAEIEQRLGLKLADQFLMVTFQPATLDAASPADQVSLLLDVIAATGLPAVVTGSNADPGAHGVRAVIEERAGRDRRLQFVETLGTEMYFSLMALAAVMVGNSSSGLIEAPSFRLPVVNVGSRQQGRLRAANVIDVDATRDAIAAGIRRALEPSFARSLAGLENPYGDGQAADRIVARLANVDLGANLLQKRFVDR